jgi:hypothetical protein
MASRTFIEKLILNYQKQSLRTKSLFWVIVGACVILLIPSALQQRRISQLHQARVYFATPGIGIVPGQMFPVEIRVQTNGTPINAVSTHVNYNPAFLEVVNMTTEKSFCTFYLDNAFDNIKGEVKVSCGLPSPGFQGDSIVLRMNMRAKASGSTNVTMDESRSMVLANDGKGSNIASDLPSLTLTVQPLL